MSRPSALAAMVVVALFASQVWLARRLLESRRRLRADAEMIESLELGRRTRSLARPGPLVPLRPGAVPDGASWPLLALPAVAGLGTAKRLLLVFLSPTDCSACLGESQGWEALSEGPRAIPVIGVIGGTSLAEAQQAAADAHLTFPMFFDKRSRLAESLGILRTPAEILLDGRGNTLLADGPEPTLGAQEQFVARVRTLTPVLSRHRAAGRR